MFYVLAILNSVMRIVQIVLIYLDFMNADDFYRLIPAFIKINIGFLTIWILIELRKRVSQSINYHRIISKKDEVERRSMDALAERKFIEKLLHQIDLDEKALKRTEKQIKIGRILINIWIILNLTVLVCVFFYLD